MTGLNARNPAVQHLRRLARRRSARTDANAYLIDGPVLVGDALDAGVSIEIVYVDEAAAADAKVADVVLRLHAAGIRIVDLAAGVLAGAVDTVHPQGIAAVARPDPRPLSSLIGDVRGLLVVLAGVNDPGNAGTILRSAEASGARAVIATAGSVDLFAPKTVRASAGALFHLPVVDGADAVGVVAALRTAGFRTLGTVAHDGEPYDEVDLTGPVAVVLGNEAHGLPAEVDAILDGHLTIPMRGRAESLNVAMAGTLLCFESARQARAAKR